MNALVQLAEQEYQLVKARGFVSMDEEAVIVFKANMLEKAQEFMCAMVFAADNEKTTTLTEVHVQTAKRTVRGTQK